MALRSGQVPTSTRPVPSLGDGAVSFVHRARDGVALTETRRTFAKSTIDGYETALRCHVLDWVDGKTGLAFADLSSDALDARKIQAMVDGLAARRSNETARQAHAALRAVLRDLYNRELVDTLPPNVRLPSPAAPRERALTIDEADRAMAAAELDDVEQAASFAAPLLALLIGTGARIGEIRQLEWGPRGVDLDACPVQMVVRRETTKTDAGARTIPIEDQYARTLRAHFHASGSPSDGTLVLTTSDGSRLKPGGRDRSVLGRVAHLAGLTDVTAHVFRHSQGTWLASAGHPSASIASRLGHSDSAFTQRRYIKPMQHDLDAAPSILAALREKHRAELTSV